MNLDALRQILDGRESSLRLGCYVGLLGLLIPYMALRGLADTSPLPHQDFLLIEHVIGFGQLPADRLQVMELDWLFLTVPSAWFLIPEIVTLYIVLRHWDLFPSLALTRLTILYLAVISFYLLPTEPPWMHGAVRVAEQETGPIVDGNPIAAFPSLHVALPLALTLWFASHGFRAIAGGLALFSLLTMVGVVYLGEHHVVDVVAGAGFAYVIVWLDSRWLAWRERRTVFSPVPTTWPGVPATLSIGDGTLQPAVSEGRSISAPVRT